MSSPISMVGAAIFAIGVLLAATHFALDNTRNLFQQNHLNQLNAQLDLADQLLNNWQNEHLNNVAGLSRLSWVQRWTAEQLRSPKGVAKRSLPYQQLRQLYLQQGYHGHALFDSQPRLVDDSNDGMQQQFTLPGEAAEVLRQSALRGMAISRPFPAPLHLHYADQPVGTLMYLACARLQPEVGEGSLCLHFDQQQGLAALLDKVGHNHMGNLYALEPNGRTFGATPNIDVTNLHIGYQEHHASGQVSLTRWSTALQLHLVLEVPLSSWFAPYHLSRNLILTLSTLACVLIIGLLALSLRSRKQLANREALYRQILDQLPVQIRVRNLEGQMRLENQLATSSQYAIQKNLPLAAGGASLSELSQTTLQLLQRVEACAQVKSQDFVHGEPDQEQFHALRLVGFPIFDHQQRLRALGSLAIDQSSSVKNQYDLRALAQRLEEEVDERTAELAEARDAAESAARAKADFLANMSHEIRSPLSAVLGLAHLAERSNQNPQVASYLQRIITAAGHLQEMLNDILDFSKFEAGKLKLEHIAFSPERLLESVADIVWDKAQRKNLSVLFDLDPHLPEQFYGDPLRLSQILINLADNAIKFTAEGMVAIRVRALSNQGPSWQVCFEVQDSGIGIPTEDIEHIFKPFEQLDQSIARRHGGTGLGLPICRQLAKLMGASFEARSQLGLGSLFSITVTLTQVTEQAEPLHLPAGSQRALIIDAKAPSRASLSAKLAALGLYVEHANSAQAAFDLLAQQQRYQWLFIDWDLPDMASHDFAARIHAQKLAPQSLCVLLSGRGTGRMLPPEVLQQFAAVLDKPVSPLKLRETVLRLERPALPSFSNKHVLLVEDEPLNQEVACELLTALKLKVTVATNGEQALSCLAQDQSIDVVLLDIQMPVLDGLATINRLRPLYPDLPVIAMTGNCLPGDRERYLAAGMHDYLAKPFQPEALAFLLSRWLTPLPTPPAPRDALLNQSQALERLLGNQALYERLLKRFREDYQDFANTLSSYLAAEDTLHAGELLHSFKSLVATLGAQRLHTLAVCMEAKLRQGLCVREQTDALGNELTLLLVEIDKLLAIKEVNA